MVKLVKLLVFVIGGVVAFTFLFTPGVSQAVEPLPNSQIRHGSEALDRTTFFKLLVQASSPGEAGAKAYPAASIIVKNNSPEGEILKKAWQKQLYPFFKELPMDKIRVHWGAFLVQEWTFSDYSIELKGDERNAQSYGYHIYFKAQRNQLSDEEFLPLLIHQLEHVRQYHVDCKGSLKTFGKNYFTQYYGKAQKNYAKNEMEKSARQTVAELLQFVVTIENATPQPITFTYSWKDPRVSQGEKKQLPKNKAITLSDETSSSLQIRFKCGEQFCLGTLPARAFLGKGKPKPQDGERYIFKSDTNGLRLRKAENVQTTIPVVYLKE